MRNSYYWPWHNDFYESNMTKNGAALYFNKYKTKSSTNKRKTCCENEGPIIAYGMQKVLTANSKHNTTESLKLIKI